MERHPRRRTPRTLVDTFSRGDVQAIIRRATEGRHPRRGDAHGGTSRLKCSSLDTGLRIGEPRVRRRSTCPPSARPWAAFVRHRLGICRSYVSSWWNTVDRVANSADGFLSSNAASGRPFTNTTTSVQRWCSPSTTVNGSITQKSLSRTSWSSTHRAYVRRSGHRCGGTRPSRPPPAAAATAGSPHAATANLTPARDEPGRWLATVPDLRDGEAVDVDALVEGFDASPPR